MAEAEYFPAVSDVIGREALPLLSFAESVFPSSVNETVPVGVTEPPMTEAERVTVSPTVAGFGVADNVTTGCTVDGVLPVVVLVTFRETGVEELAAKLESPAYEAVMLYDPEAMVEVVKLAIPELLSDPDPMDVPFAKKVTVPVGAAEPEVVMVADRVMLVPADAELGVRLRVRLVDGSVAEDPLAMSMAPMEGWDGRTSPAMSWTRPVIEAPAPRRGLDAAGT